MARCLGCSYTTACEAVNDLVKGRNVFGAVLLHREGDGKGGKACSYKPVDLRPLYKVVSHSTTHVRRTYKPDVIAWQKEYLPIIRKAGYEIPQFDSLMARDPEEGYTCRISLRKFPRTALGTIRTPARITYSYAARSYGPAYSNLSLEHGSDETRAGPSGPEAGISNRKIRDQELKSDTTRSQAKSSRRRGRRRGRWSNGEEARAFAQEHGLDLKALGVDYDRTLGSLYVQFDGALFIALLQLQKAYDQKIEVRKPKALLNSIVRRLGKIRLGSEFSQKEFEFWLSYSKKQDVEASPSSAAQKILKAIDWDILKRNEQVIFEKKMRECEDWGVETPTFELLVTQSGCALRTDKIWVSILDFSTPEEKLGFVKELVAGTSLMSAIFGDE